MKKYIRAINRRIRKKAQRICAENGLLASWYYVLFDPSFRREQMAVLQGTIEHNKMTKEEKANYYLLVRNTHRLEKGILMRPRKDVFALSYIEETMNSFEKIWQYDAIEGNPQMKWFYDVLNRYFEICGNNDKLKSLKTRFAGKVNGQIPAGFPDDDGTCKELFAPYYRVVGENNIPTYNAFYNLTRQRRSVRWFLNKPVPRELIDKAVLAAIQSPSACNRQPFEFRIFDDPEKVKKIATIPMGTKGYSHNVKVFVVLVGNLEAYFDERDRHNIYVDGSLAAMSFMLALESLGISSCSVNWPDIENKEKTMSAFLGLKAFQRPVLCMSIGYPDPEGMVAYSAKRPLETIRKYNN